MDELTSLAIAAGHGDRDALARLVRQTQADVWRLCAHLVDPAAADDLTQDTYLRAIPALPRFRGDAPARAWLLAIAWLMTATLRGRSMFCGRCCSGVSRMAISLSIGSLS